MREAEAKKTFTASEHDGINAIEIAGKYNSKIIARNLGIELSLFNKLNPNFDKLILAGNTYTLRLPAEKMALFTSKKNNILSESVQYLLNGEAMAL